MSELRSQPPLDSEEYLKKIDQEKFSLQEALDNLKYLVSPAGFSRLGEPLIFNDEITDRYRYHDLNLNYRIKPLDLDLYPPNKAESFSEIVRFYRGAKLQSVAEITSLTIKRDQAKEPLRLWQDLLPDNRYRILLHSSFSNSFFTKQKVITTNNIFSPEGLLALLHECGHAHHYEILDDEQRGRYNRLAGSHQYSQLTRSEMALILNRERRAWAWTLTKLRPFLSKDRESGLVSYQDIISYIHKQALRSYGEKIAEQLKFDRFSV